MKTLKQLVSQKVQFVSYRKGTAIYKTEDGFEFPVPVDEIGDGTLNAEDKGIIFMKWIGKQLKEISKL